MSEQPRAWAVILGASSGFGAAVAVTCAREGLNVCGVHLDRRATLAEAERTKALIEEMGRHALFFNVNAADVDKRRQVIDTLAGHTPPRSVKLLFHSLAFGSLVPLIGKDVSVSAKPAQISMTLDVMAASLVYWTQELIWRDLMGEGGRILAMTSSGSSRAMASYGVISAAKAALEAFVRQLALELGPRGITVNAIRAGVTDTAALRKIPGWEKLKERSQWVNPGGRNTVPDDVARAVAMMLADGASWISGNVIGVDGGEEIAG